MPVLGTQSPARRFDKRPSELGTKPDADINPAAVAHAEITEKINVTSMMLQLVAV